MSLLESLLSPDLTALGMIIVIDIVMSGDNAIIIGMAAAGLEPELRRRAIVYGIAGATILRILFAAAAFHLLAILGLTLAGGLLLAWVCWRMWRDLRNRSAARPKDAPLSGDSATHKVRPAKTLRGAMITIIVADVSMSLDNILAVAGAARDHLGMLVFGLILSIALMAVAATYIARVLERHKWIAYVGLVIVAYVAGDMIWRGTDEIRALVLAFAQGF